MKRVSTLLLIALALLTPRAAAHSVAVDMDVFLKAGRLIVLMGGPGGGPINGAKLEYVLFNESGQTYRSALPQVADGEYGAGAPKAAAGVYTLLLRDTTFQGEALEAQVVIAYPPSGPLRLALPPSKAGAPDATVLIALTVAPVALSLLVLVFILVSRRQPKVLHSQPLEPHKPLEESS